MDLQYVERVQKLRTQVAAVVVVVMAITVVARRSGRDGQVSIEPVRFVLFGEFLDRTRQLAFETLVEIARPASVQVRQDVAKPVHLAGRPHGQHGKRE